MKEFKKVDKVFLKSNNTVQKIWNRYLFCLLPYIALIIIYNLIWGSTTEIINLFKSIAVSFVVSFLTQYLFNIIKKEKDISKIFLEDSILSISIILGLFAIHSKIYIIIASAIITVVVKNISKSSNLSSSLYGILLILLSNYFLKTTDTSLLNLAKNSYVGTFSNIVEAYGSISNFLLGLTTGYLSPILSIVVFLYLFHKKSIKYSLFLSYVMTFSFVMLIIGLLNGMNVWYVFFQLTTGNILFLSVFCLTDYPNTPTTEKGQIIYGILLATLTCILRFIVPEFAVVIPMILGPLLFTKIINRISFKLKYNQKYYYTMLSISIIITIFTTTILNILI